MNNLKHLSHFLLSRPVLDFDVVFSEEAQGLN